MTTKEAKAISIVSLFWTLGFSPVYSRKNDDELWYISVFRTNEKDPSFKITISKNSWYDFGSGAGGSIIDFLLKFKGFDIKGCFEFLENLSIKKEKIDFDSLPKFESSDKVELRSIKELKNRTLCEYVQSRKIDLEIARIYIKEVYYRRNDTNFFSIGIKNDLDGYEIRTKSFKGCIINKAITTIKNEFNSVSIFEGFIDFLSLLTIKEISSLQSDVIILHSTYTIEYGINEIKKMGYSKIYSFFDNDDAGDKAFEKIKNINGVKDMRYLYKNHKDVNKWLESSHIIS